MKKVTAISILALTTAFGCNSGGSGGTSDGASGGVQACVQNTGSKMVDSASALPKSLEATAKGLKRLRGHTFARNAQATDQGKTDETQELPITVSLELDNPEGLDQRIAELYRPGSANFHRFMTPDEFHAQFGPSKDKVAQVTQYLQDQGFRSITADDGGMIVRAVGPVSKINTAFHTELRQFKDTQGNAYRAPNAELQIPDGLPIQGVHGLQNLTHARAHSHRAAATSNPVSKAATGPSGGFSPSDIKTAYNLPAGLDGSGQTLGLFELDGYTASDITQYENQFNLPAAPLQNVLVDGADGSAGGGSDEVTLDIELMIALAPKTSKIVVYEGPNSDTGILDTYAKIANDNIAQSVSSSWGDSEDDVTSSFLQSENTIFKQMAAQGQTIYSAAGDSGADDNGSSLSIDDPSGQPYVVAVGGTTLATNSSGVRSSESTWNDGGGGISAVWTIPDWQQGIATSTNKASTTMRNIPDVSLNSDINTGYSIYSGGTWGVWGGTSCAAPLWAAFNALLNQQRAINGQGPIGYITPLLYTVGKSPAYASNFFDVSDSSTNGFYPAVSGFDDATGWGPFNAATLIETLAGNAPSVPACSGS